MNFVILFDENCIYTCSKNGMQRDFFNLQVQLKAHMITEEFGYSRRDRGTLALGAH